MLLEFNESRRLNSREGNTSVTAKLSCSSSLLPFLRPCLLLFRITSRHTTPPTPHPPTTPARPATHEEQSCVIAYFINGTRPPGSRRRRRCVASVLPVRRTGEGRRGRDLSGDAASLPVDAVQTAR